MSPKKQTTAQYDTLSDEEDGLGACDLDGLDRVSLQALAKKQGLKANLASAVLVADLKLVREGKKAPVDHYLAARQGLMAETLKVVKEHKKKSIGACVCLVAVVVLLAAIAPRSKPLPPKSPQNATAVAPPALGVRRVQAPMGSADPTVRSSDGKVDEYASYNLALLYTHEANNYVTLPAPLSLDKYREFVLQSDFPEVLNYKPFTDADPVRDMRFPDTAWLHKFHFNNTAALPLEAALVRDGFTYPMYLGTITATSGGAYIEAWAEFETRYLRTVFGFPAAPVGWADVSAPKYIRDKHELPSARIAPQDSYDVKSIISAAYNKALVDYANQFGVLKKDGSTEWKGGAPPPPPTSEQLNPLMAKYVPDFGVTPRFLAAYIRAKYGVAGPEYWYLMSGTVGAAHRGRLATGVGYPAGSGGATANPLSTQTPVIDAKSQAAGTPPDFAKYVAAAVGSPERLAGLIANYGLYNTAVGLIRTFGPDAFKNAGGARGAEGAKAAVTRAIKEFAAAGYDFSDVYPGLNAEAVAALKLAGGAGGGVGTGDPGNVGGGETVGYPPGSGGPQSNPLSAYVPVVDAASGAGVPADFSNWVRDALDNPAKLAALVAHYGLYNTAVGLIRTFGTGFPALGRAADELAAAGFSLAAVYPSLSLSGPIGGGAPAAPADTEGASASVASTGVGGAYHTIVAGCMLWICLSHALCL